MKHIAVIGAGMAGLTATRDLAGAGHTVTVFDKSRGVGGRLATRRSDAGAFDHGAPRVHGDAPGFEAAMASLGGSAVRDGDGWRGVPGMSGLLKPWTAGLERHAGCRIVAVEEQEGAGVRLTDEHGTHHGPFDAAIVAIPAPQLAELFPQAGLSGVVMEPVWTLMAAWEADAEMPRGVAAPFGSIIGQGRPGAFVAHADSAWSRDNLERDKPDVARDLSGRLGAALGLRDAPLHAVAHRWRYARVARPLGRPFLAISDRILAGGDWALGPDAGHAWQSGRAMAETLMGLTERDAAG